MKIDTAVTEYLALEKQANENTRGADHMSIMASVASKYGVDVEVLTEAVLDASFAGPS